jgi:CheY-like chemotaxis protein
MGLLSSPRFFRRHATAGFHDSSLALQRVPGYDAIEATSQSRPPKYQVMSRHLILHVENDPNDIFLIHRAFREATITVPVQVVEDGQRAIDYLLGAAEFHDRQKFPLPSLIFLDLSMPKMNGTEFLEWLRHQPVLKRIPVIVFTSSRHASDIDTSFELGASSYLVKPVSYKELVEQIQAFKRYWLAHSEFPDVQQTLAS